MFNLDRNSSPTSTENTEKVNVKTSFSATKTLNTVETSNVSGENLSKYILHTNGTAAYKMPGRNSSSTLSKNHDSAPQILANDIKGKDLERSFGAFHKTKIIQQPSNAFQEILNSQSNQNSVPLFTPSAQMPNAFLQDVPNEMPPLPNAQDIAENPLSASPGLTQNPKESSSSIPPPLPNRPPPPIPSSVPPSAPSKSNASPSSTVSSKSSVQPLKRRPPMPRASRRNQPPSRANHNLPPPPTATTQNTVQNAQAPTANDDLPPLPPSPGLPPLPPLPPITNDQLPPFPDLPPTPNITPQNIALTTQAPNTPPAATNVTPQSDSLLLLLESCNIEKKAAARDAQATFTTTLTKKHPQKALMLANMVNVIASFKIPDLPRNQLMVELIKDIKDSCKDPLHKTMKVVVDRLEFYQLWDLHEKLASSILNGFAAGSKQDMLIALYDSEPKNERDDLFRLLYRINDDEDIENVISIRNIDIKNIDWEK
jgi:hypothetical protein